MASVEHDEEKEDRKLEKILWAEGVERGEAAQTEAVRPVSRDKAPRRGGNIKAQHKGHEILGINTLHPPT